MFTEEGLADYKKVAEWVGDKNYMLSPNFIPTDDTPQEAIDYCKYMMSDMVDFNAEDFEWPTGIGMNL